MSRPAELYCQLALIDKKFFGSFKDFALRYCAATQTQFGLNSSGQSNLKELNVILRRKFMIRWVTTAHPLNIYVDDQERFSLIAPFWV